MDPAAMAAMLGGGSGAGISRDQAEAFAKMMSAAASGGAPAGPPPTQRQPTREEMEQEKEQYIQAYAKYLEELKVTNPAEYKAVMQDLQEAANEAKKGFEPVLPGGGKKLGADGINGTKEEERVEITPNPGFVIKTQNAAGVKVFINVCHSDQLRKPSKKKQLQADGTEQEGLNIPLSMDGPHPITTKRGEKAVVFDCVVNTTVIDDVKADRTGAFRHFVCELCIQYIGTKYKTQLSQQYKLPQSQYKGGKVRSQYIRKRQAPVIEEVEEPTPSTRSPPKPAAGSKPKAQKVIRVKAPDEHAKHSILCRDTAGGELYAWANEDESPGANDGRSPVEIVVRILLDKMPADSLPDVDVAEEVVVLKAAGHHPLELYLPRTVDPDSDAVVVQLDRSTATLELVLPVTQNANGRDGLQPDRGSKPWLLSQALTMGDEGDADSAGAGGGKEAEGKRKSQHISSSTAYGTSGAPVQEDEALPEDRFHKADIMSQHLLMERAKEKAERRKKQAEKDKKEAEEKAAKGAAEAAAAAEAEVKKREEAIAAAAAADNDTGDGDVVLSNAMAFDLLD